MSLPFCVRRRRAARALVGAARTEEAGCSSPADAITWLIAYELVAAGLTPAECRVLANHLTALASSRERKGSPS